MGYPVGSKLTYIYIYIYAIISPYGLPYGMDYLSCAAASRASEKLLPVGSPEAVLIIDLLRFGGACAHK